MGEYIVSSRSRLIWAGGWRLEVVRVDFPLVTRGEWEERIRLTRWNVDRCAYSVMGVVVAGLLLASTGCYEQDRVSRRQGCDIVVLPRRSIDVRSGMNFFSILHPEALGPRPLSHACPSQSPEPNVGKHRKLGLHNYTKWRCEFGPGKQLVWGDAVMQGTRACVVEQRGRSLRWDDEGWRLTLDARLRALLPIVNAHVFMLRDEEC